MVLLQNRIFKYWLVCLCCFSMFACSSFDFFNKGSDPVAKESVTENIAAQPETGDEPDKPDALKQELESTNQSISDLKNEISVLEKKVSGLENRLSNQKPVVVQVAYTDPEQLYQTARNLLLEGNSTQAAQLFETFVAQHPDHSLADNAMYWLGECHYSSGQYAEAVTVFKNLVTAYPKAEKVPDALLKTGYAYLSMDDTTRAHHYLKSVLTQYPFSPAAEKAQEKLKEFE
jgi:tol-pal system protein YbgF